jgi:hypothetical protein
MTRLPVAVDIVVATGWALASVVAMTWGTLVKWPDYLHTNYGFPLTFATHTLDTIAGPVDKWTVDIGALSIDLSFWLLGMVTILVASAYFLSRIKKRENTAGNV